MKCAGYVARAREERTQISLRKLKEIVVLEDLSVNERISKSVL
jgi:hypothetical protein